MPAVTVPPRPNGLPIATTQSPTRRASESPNFTNGNSLPSFGSIFSTATSVLGSVPSSLAGNSLSSYRRTVISSASAITWLFVTTIPSDEIRKPEPSDWARRGCCAWLPPFRQQHVLTNRADREPVGKNGLEQSGPPL